VLPFVYGFSSPIPKGATGMRKWIQSIDDLLRGETTRLDRLRTGAFDVPIVAFVLHVVVFGAFYGFCMSWLALMRPVPVYLQVVSSMVKMPALFLLTLAVTFPSLYVFNALVGSRLAFLSILRLLMAAVAINLAVLASFGPIVAFFSLTTTSYAFMVLLNVLVFTISGLLGLAFLVQTLHRLTLIDSQASPSDTATEPAGAIDRIPGSVLARNVKTVFVVWIVVFGLVGAQMSWVLRPFIGNPDQPFAWFRGRESNFFEAVVRAIGRLLS
jgi:hypothetical protein